MDQVACAQDVINLHSSLDMKAVLLSVDHPAIPISEMGAILIASPHPDDEILGCGGLLGICARDAHPVSVLAMTNGEASHPGDQKWRDSLGKTRQREQLNALKALGFASPDIIPLRLPDGELEQLEGEQRKHIIELIQNIIRSRNVRTLFLPAVDDRHADHRETALLLAEAVRNCPVKYVFSYQIWPPSSARSAHIPMNEVAYTLDVSSVLTLKRRALEEHRSQLGIIEPSHSEGFRMPQALLDEKLRDQECYALIRDLTAWSA